MYQKYDEFIDNMGILTDQDKKLSDIQKELMTIIEHEQDEEIKQLLRWESELYICCEIPLERRLDGQQYLFPHVVTIEGKNIPDIDAFIEERWDFYTHRLEITSNVIVKMRYANYCFQYCEKKDKYKYARQICELLCEQLPKMTLKYEYVVCFSRLFELSLLYNIVEIKEKLDNVIKEAFMRDYSDDNYLELLSLSRIIVSNISRNKSKLIKDDTRDQVVNLMAEMVNYYFKNGEYILYRNSCTVFIDWLKLLKNQDKINEELLRVGESYELDAEKEGNSNLIKAEFYQMAAWHYANIGEREKVYHLKIKIKEAFREASNSNEYKTISTTQSIPVAELEEEIKDIIKEDVKDTLNLVSHGRDFILNKDKIANKAAEQVKNPLYKIVDFGHIEGNRKVFTTKNEGDLLKHITFQNYSIELEVVFSTIVNFIWNKMIENGLTAQMVIDRICSSDYMEEDQKKFISNGIKRFFEDDYVSTLHILVPQFESCFRTFFEWGGFPTTSLKTNGLQYEENFNDFLREDFVRETLDNDFLFMVEFVMVEQLGKNLRNNIAHGLSSIKTFNKNNCLIVIYLFWMITAIKWKFPEEGADEQ